MKDSANSHDGFTTLIIEDDSLYERGYASGPERALMTALLFDGVQACLTFAFSDSENQKSKYLEAYRWIRSEDSEYIFSFENVCEALGVDPEGLRLGILNFINSNQIEDGEFRRSRRTF